jgi:cytochrome c-type protein NapB
LFPIAGALLGGMLVFVCGAIYAQNAPQVVPRVTGAASPMGEVPAPALARPVIDDKRLMRNYPEQPPIIPHSIDNYQLTRKTNRGLDCHRRQFTALGRADDQRHPFHASRRADSADVTPRRYFCTVTRIADRRAAAGPKQFKDMLLVEPGKK